MEVSDYGILSKMDSVERMDTVMEACYQLFLVQVVKNQWDLIEAMQQLDMNPSLLPDIQAHCRVIQSIQHTTKGTNYSYLQETTWKLRHCLKDTRKDEKKQHPNILLTLRFDDKKPMQIDCNITQAHALLAQVKDATRYIENL